MGSVSSLLFSLDTCLLSQRRAPHILFISLKESNKGIYFMFFSLSNVKFTILTKNGFPQCTYNVLHYNRFCNMTGDVQTAPSLTVVHADFPLVSITQWQFHCQLDLELNNLFYSLFGDLVLHFADHVPQKNLLVSNSIALYKFVSTVGTLTTDLCLLAKQRAHILL